MITKLFRKRIISTVRYTSGLMLSFRSSEARDQGTLLIDNSRPTLFPMKLTNTHVCQTSLRKILSSADYDWVTRIKHSYWLICVSCQEKFTVEHILIH